jgi:cytidylate kinase
MPFPKIIAIDGPAASGKSTLAYHLAADLNYLFFDTGVMYRAVTWAAIKNGIPITDEPAITRLAQQVQIDVLPPSASDGRAYDVLVDGQDVTWEIRQPDVEGNVSPVSAYPGVRRAMSVQQRRIGMRGRVVMVGRDIGTVVLPEAEIKIYLDASVEERARRRYMEVLARGASASYEAILESMRRRDKIDSTRAVAPLCPAPDAITINTGGMSLEQVLQKVKELLNR